MKYGMIAKVIILMNEDLMKVSINYMTLKVVLYDWSLLFRWTWVLCHLFARCFCCLLDFSFDIGISKSMSSACFQKNNTNLIEIVILEIKLISPHFQYLIPDKCSKDILSKRTLLSFSHALFIYNWNYIDLPYILQISTSSNMSIGANTLNTVSFDLRCLC